MVTTSILPVEQPDPSPLLDDWGVRPVHRHRSRWSVHPSIFDAIPPDDFGRFWLLSHRHRRWIGHFLPQLDPPPCRTSRSIRGPVDRPSHQAWKIGLDLGFPVLETDQLAYRRVGDILLVVV